MNIGVRRENEKRGRNEEIYRKYRSYLYTFMLQCRTSIVNLLSKEHTAQNDLSRAFQNSYNAATERNGRLVCDSHVSTWKAYLLKGACNPVTQYGTLVRIRAQKNKRRKGVILSLIGWVPGPEKGG